jgi:serine/threonine-protein kinase
MEYVEGKPLRALLEAGALAESEALAYAIQLASALDHAHSRGILHRDIKPENAIVDAAGVAKLVDFGIAKTLAADTEAPTAITSPGMFVGTLKYAPPEVLSGLPASRQSDLYSFGVMLYEMACGQTPFDGMAAMAAVGAILHGERAAVRSINAAVSEGLAEVIARSMQREPEARFASATEMLQALQAVRDSGGAPSAARSPAVEVPALAVLEFTNVTRDPAVDWLGVGIVETLEGELRKLSGLQVVSRGRAQQVIRGLRLDLEEPAGLVKLGNRLQAKWVATGSFQRAGNRIRVTTRLVDVPAGETVPIEKDDGVWDDLFDVQDRVVAALVHALDVGGGATEARPQPAGVPSLDAYEHYANGRRAMHELGQGSLVEAKQHFERALALDPHYALAYSGLGSVYALTCIQTSNAEDFARGRQYLERALELDAELGEPYPWLCYIYSRTGEAEKALAAGERGVKFQPDLQIAYYFYGVSLLGAVESGLGSYQKALDNLQQAFILEPQMGAQWIVAAMAALMAGQYEAVRQYSERALQIEKAPNARFRFVSGLTMLGFAHTRQLAWDAGRRYHREAIESLRSSEHVYRDVFTTLSACGLGELELRTRQPEEALTHFRHAWRIVKEKPRMSGNVRLGIRAQAGMAAAYADLGERERAEQHLAEASARMVDLSISSWTFDTMLLQLHYSLASAQLRLGLADEAVVSLSRAIDTGFANRAWFETDPEWESLRERKDYRQLGERLRNIPPETIDLSRLPALDSSVSNAGTAPPS